PTTSNPSSYPAYATGSHYALKRKWMVSVSTRCCRDSPRRCRYLGNVHFVSVHHPRNTWVHSHGVVAQLSHGVWAVRCAPARVRHRTTADTISADGDAAPQRKQTGSLGRTTRSVGRGHKPFAAQNAWSSSRRLAALGTR